MLKNQTNQKNILKILKNGRIKYQFKKNHTGFLHYGLHTLENQICQKIFQRLEKHKKFELN